MNGGHGTGCNCPECQQMIRPKVLRLILILIILAGIGIAAALYV